MKLCCVFSYFISIKREFIQLMNVQLSWAVCWIECFIFDHNYYRWGLLNVWRENTMKKYPCPSHEFQQVFSIFNKVIKSHRIDDNKSISNNVTWQLVSVPMYMDCRSNKTPSILTNHVALSLSFSFVWLFFCQSEIDWTQTYTMHTVCNDMNTNKQNVSSPICSGSCRFTSLAF